LPCRRSWVRIPSAACRKPARAAGFLRSWASPAEV